ncbi:hypothetical protein RRG08_060723 [Elysia crispata]|uniref:Uncharacterized protein n=1 Tax=Elysia crispata TaxID=231223 RepID=A0AAE0XP07_9GAST|nr:hypothetical protein RRG08_060723 [Elysia crispata]
MAEDPRAFLRCPTISHKRDQLTYPTGPRLETWGTKNSRRILHSQGPADPTMPGMLVPGEIEPCSSHYRL